ncbi:Uncharacterized protein dnm_080570 [Desulfonema magnum]|uniref:Uncharacterized protein n=1 Tax=Desulfonema magnum TaxID=45655 RepID=A0A975BUI5_9BACT|nr:Uncharacterized protein dnm_080570 [Desulfonema magnum]
MIKFFSGRLNLLIMNGVRGGRESPSHHICSKSCCEYAALTGLGGEAANLLPQICCPHGVWSALP